VSELSSNSLQCQTPPMPLQAQQLSPVVIYVPSKDGGLFGLHRV